ncbi:T9SS type A sorting domain-containing protein [Winogradskyella sp. F6397]|uniref:T9SS type A sorting domain-containing protein n=1 Tax=Winogradskyella marina TaxID=2785530 RepID=A0ABS0EJU9_9FLAO|nr:T9SS type A sorting domain-containing protein [Winogradskyella marina]MBF8150743.1 T9SS type A sorting domain-containing protein [Winogradskyella marina]
MKNIYKNFLLAIVVLLATDLSHSQAWGNFINTTSGSLDGVSFTFSISDETIATKSGSNFEGANEGDAFYAAPGSWYESAIKVRELLEGNSFTITFDSPIENLKLYLKDLRGGSFSFDQEFTVLSDYNFTAVDATTLSTGLPASGILQFNEPVTTLTMTVVYGVDAGAANRYIAFSNLESTLGIDDVFKETNALKVYPNPTADFIQVSGLKATESYSVFNVLGEEVRSGLVSENDQIEVGNLESGLYFLKLESGNTMKFMKK